MSSAPGAKALYLSGSGVATASYGLPDLGITDMNDGACVVFTRARFVLSHAHIINFPCASVVTDVRRVTRATNLPLLVDIDTGFGSAFNIARCVTEIERAGAAAVHIEDQIQAKRCGHRPNKQIVSCDEMCDRIRAAVSGRRDTSFVIMARTDALANEGMQACIDRCRAYLAAGADMLFPEAFNKLEQYKQLRTALGPSVPILANITEFGQTPLYNSDELAAHGVSMVLYPLSAFRAMSRAAATVYRTIIADRTQTNAIPLMQTRDELYDTLDYYTYERKLDALFGQEVKTDVAAKAAATKPKPKL